jgi:4-amino-4-deoxy-L-arabinose transferase-like glycosyltransferase
MEKGREYEIEKRISWFKEKVWKKENRWIILLLVGVTVMYLYYFFKVGAQPIWWDEGDYLMIAKVFGEGFERPERWGDFIKIRPVFLPLIWAGFLKLGSSEIVIRFFTELLPGIICVGLVYVIGKELFSRRVGLIGALLIAVNWVFMFYNFRLLTDTPSLFFALLSIYFFWVKYEKPLINGLKERPLFLWLAVAFGVMAFLTRYVAALSLIAIGFYLVFTRRAKLFKSKNIGIAILVGLIVMAPYFFYNYQLLGSPFPAFAEYHGEQATAPDRPIAWDVLTFHLPNFLKIYQLTFLAIGMVFLLQILLYFDIIIKQKEKSKNNLFFALLLIMVPLVYFVFGIRAVDARYFVSTMPLIFVIMGIGVDFISNKIKEILRYKHTYKVVVLIILAFLVYQQVSLANDFIITRSESFMPVKQGGEWLEKNTPEGSKVVTASINQNFYYSSRESFDYYTTDDIWDDCQSRDPETLLTSLSLNETCQKGTEEAFNRKVEEIGADYLIVSIYEQSFTPRWAYDYPNRYGLKPVAAFPENTNQPVLIIYEFPK